MVFEVFRFLHANPRGDSLWRLRPLLRTLGAMMPLMALQTLSKGVLSPKYPKSSLGQDSHGQSWNRYPAGSCAHTSVSVYKVPTKGLRLGQSSIYCVGSMVPGHLHMKRWRLCTSTLPREPNSPRHIPSLTALWAR